MAADWTWNSAYSVSRQEEQPWGWREEGACFSRFTAHFLLSVQGESAWTISFNSQDSAWSTCYHSPFMQRSSERLSELSKATYPQSCATLLSSASPSRGDHEKQETPSQSAALWAALSSIISKQTGVRRGMNLLKHGSCVGGNEASGWIHYL